MSTQSWVDVLRSMSERLRDELGALTPAQWETPGACGDWTVAEVVSHLAGATQTLGGSVHRAQAGDSAPPPGLRHITDRDEGSAWIKERAIARRREVGDNVFPRYVSGSAFLVESFARLRPGDWRRAFHIFCGVIPVSAVFGWALAELGLHGRDIRTALGRQAHLPEASLEPLVGWLPYWLMVALHPAEPLQRPVRYRIELADPVSQVLGVTVHGDRFAVERGAGKPAQAVVSTDPEAFILLATGRMTWAAALEAGRIDATGEADPTEMFGRWFLPL